MPRKPVADWIARTDARRMRRFPCLARQSSAGEIWSSAARLRRVWPRALAARIIGSALRLREIAIPGVDTVQPCMVVYRLSMTATFFVPGPLPGLNEIIASAKSGAGKRNAYARLKSEWSGIVAAHARAARLPAFVGRVYLSCRWVEPSRRRDPDNVHAAVKFVLDGLVECGVLAGDGQGAIDGIGHEQIEVDAQAPGVHVSLSTFGP